MSSKSPMSTTEKILKEIEKSQKALLEQQKIRTASTLRSELRSINALSPTWAPLPLLNGDPLPGHIFFPIDPVTFDNMDNSDVDILLSVYHLASEPSELEREEIFDLTGKRRELLRAFIAPKHDN
ncbi:hypothetical protein ABKN59_010226 [Abortiporus biennis]